MILLLPLLLYLPGLSLDALEPLSTILHSWCLDRAHEQASLYTDIHSALICGERLPAQGEIKKLFTDSGIIHLMVVSGVHLLFLEKMWNVFPKWPYKSILILFSLIFYCLVASLHPPVVRALISYLIYKFSHHFRLFWSPLWQVMLSGMVCLALQPEWARSISLQMSWIGALAFSFSYKSKIYSHILIYILFLPIISQWQAVNPLSVLVNWIFVPIMSIILFPLSVLSFFIPIFHFLSDSLWSSTLFILRYTQVFLHKMPFYIKPLPQDLIWLYIGGIFFVAQGTSFILRYLSYKNKESACSSL